ncbi:hypothetical protein D3C72_1675830 [compost metagenome]
MRTAGIATQVERIGRTRIMFDLRFGQAPSQVVLGFPIAQVETRFQIRIETVTDVGGNPLAAATAVLLIAIVLSVSQGHVVVQVTQDLARTDLALGIAAAAHFIANLQRRGVVTGVGDVINGATQGQSAAVETVGAA